MKNICNNLLNVGKFVFLEFSLQIVKDRELTSAGGYLSCSDLHAVYDRDVALQTNIRKAPKLILQRCTLIPINKMFLWLWKCFMKPELQL